MNASALTGTIGDVVHVIDTFLLTGLHGLAVRDSGVLASLSSLVGILTEKGVVFLLFGFVFLSVKGTRKAGLTLIGAVCLSAVVAGILKELFARPRPFGAGPEFEAWWHLAGASPESGFSLPSGHASVAMAAATALCMSFGKRFGWIAISGAVLIGVTRCYLMVHYPSDVAAGFAVGFAGSLAAHLFVQRFFGVMETALGALLRFTSSVLARARSGNREGL